MDSPLETPSSDGVNHQADPTRLPNTDEALDVIVKPGEEPFGGQVRVAQDEVLLAVGYFSVDGKPYEGALRVFAEGEYAISLIDGSSSIVPTGFPAQARFCEYLAQGPDDVEPQDWAGKCP
jgi:hypothetical protein